MVEACALLMPRRLSRGNCTYGIDGVEDMILRVQWRQADDPSGGRPAGSPDYMCPHRRHIPLPNPCIHLSKKIKRIGNKKRAFPNRRRRRRDLLLLFVGPGDLSSAYGTRARRPPGTQSGKRAAASPSRLTPGGGARSTSCACFA